MAQKFLSEIFLIFGALAFGLAQEQVIQNLGPLGVDPSPLTISGFSSGGNMAQQMQVAFSSCFNGSAAFAAVPYHCGIENYMNYRVLCNFGFRRVDQFVREAKNFEKEGKIDPLSNLRNQRHYHYVPQLDTLVGFNSRVRENTKEFFINFGMKSDNIQLVRGKNSDHWMPTDNPNLPSCTNVITFKLDVGIFGRNTSGASSCNYNGALEGLRFVLQNESELSRPDGTRQLQPLLLFNQTRFLNANDAKFLDPIGYIYVPSNCANGTNKCKFHVALHGCRGSRSAVGKDFVTQSGYLEVAEANDIVIMFPQSIPFEGNNDGCWDAFEATGPDAATKSGKQMRAMMDMIKAATGIQGCN